MSFVILNKMKCSYDVKGETFSPDRCVPSRTEWFHQSKASSTLFPHKQACTGLQGLLLKFWIIHLPLVNPMIFHPIFFSSNSSSGTLMIILVINHPQLPFTITRLLLPLLLLPSSLLECFPLPYNSMRSRTGLTLTWFFWIFLKI